MKLIPTALPGVLIVEPAVFKDDRGWFMESYKDPAWRAALHNLGLPQPRPFLQDNHSCSQAGVLRGLHYQLPPHPQGKLVRVVSGSAFDVAVDIRQGSPHFGQWVGVELTADNHRQLWIPEGFAHGFMALEDNTHFLTRPPMSMPRTANAASAGTTQPLALPGPRSAPHPAWHPRTRPRRCWQMLTSRPTPPEPQSRHSRDSASTASGMACAWLPTKRPCVST